MKVQKKLFRFLTAAGFSAAALISGCRREEAALSVTMPEKDAPPAATTSQPFVPEKLVQTKVPEPPLQKVPVQEPQKSEVSTVSKTVPAIPPLIQATETWPLTGIARPYKQPATHRPAPPVTPPRSIVSEPEEITRENPPVQASPEPEPAIPVTRPPEPVTAALAVTPREEPAAAGPFLRIQSPAGQSYYKEEIIVTGVTGNSKEEDGQADNVLGLYWSLEETPEDIRYIMFEEDGSFTSYIDTALFTGAVNIIITAEDMQRNKSSRRITLKDGRLSPGISLTAPQQGDSYGPAFYITGTVSDPYRSDEEYGGIEKVEYRMSSLLYQENESILSGIAVPGPDGSFQFEVDSSGLQGVQQLEVAVRGKNGAESIASLTLNQGEAVITRFTAKPGDEIITVDWTKLPFAESYSISYAPRRDGHPAGRSQIFTTTGPPAVISGLVNGIQYSVQVSTEINGRSISSKQIPVIPLNRNNLVPTAFPDYQRISLSWNPVPGAEGYDVLRALSPDGSNAETLARGTGDTHYIDYTADFGTRYYYAVRPGREMGMVSRFIAAESLEAPVQKLEVVNRSPEFNRGYLFSLGGYIYYAAADGGLHIIDVSLPGSLTPVGSVESEGATGLTIEKEYAFLAEGERGFKIINISDPRAPYEVSRVKTGNARDLVVNNSLLYLADGASGIKIFNVADPLYPVEEYRIKTPEAVNIRLSHNTLFVLTSDDLQIFDCTNPVRPVPLSRLELQNPSDFSLDGSNNYIYIVNNQAELIIADMQDLNMPAVITRIPLTGAITVDVQRDFAFVSLGEGGFQVIDVRDPGSPYLFEKETGSSVTDLALNGTTLFTCGSDGLKRFSAYLYGNSYETAALSLDSVVHKLSRNEDTLYASKNETGLLGISLKESTFTDAKTESITTDFASDSLTLKDLTLVAAGANGIEVYSAETPEEHPRLRIKTDAPALSFLPLQRGYLAVLMKEYGIAIYNTTEFSSLLNEPEPLTVTTPPVAFIPLADPRDFRNSEDFLIAADYQQGVRIFSIKNPVDPRLLGSYPLQNIKALSIIDNLLAAGGGGGIQILQIAEDGSTKKLYSLDIPMVESMTSDGTYLYVAQGVNGIKVIDPFAQRGPRVVSECPWIYATDILVDNSTAYAASGNNIKKIQIIIPPWLKSRE